MHVVWRCAAAAVASLLVSFGASAAKGPALPPPPEITEQSIDSADFAGWQARVEARNKAIADATRTAADEAAKKRAKKDKRSKKAKRDAPPPPAPPKIAERDLPPDPFLIRVQVLLDRAHASPGAIDGHDGDNLKKAVRAYREMHDMPPDGGLDETFWAALSTDKAKTMRIYAIYSEDVNGRYEQKLPADYAKLAKLKWLGFRGPTEMLAERFHLDEGLLKALNPVVDFKTAGQKILVPDTGEFPMGAVTRITVDKKLGELRAYDEAGKILMEAPATIGSPDTPSPGGKMTVEGVFPDPHYIYDPKKNFQQGRNKRKLNLPPGPNGPVGSMWIDLSKPTYGIHGTPEPSQISKTASHGCVRLTNWDAADLGRMVQSKKTEVEFLE